MVAHETHRTKPFARGMFLLAALALCAAACRGATNAEDLTDAEKRARIDTMYEDYRSDFPGVEEISAEELADLRKTEDVVVVDAREPEERAVSRIPGSIDKRAFEERLNKETLHDRPVVVHCTIGYRSGVYVQELAEQGIDAKNLRGSILSWVHAGQPVVDEEGNETKRVHVYGKKWDLLPEGYEGVW